MRSTLIETRHLPSAPRLAALIAAGADRLPEPGGGATLARWRALATVAQEDLALAKRYEGHTDALAIRYELVGGESSRLGNESWHVWAAEPPDSRVMIASDSAGAASAVRLDGRKAWCSGAAEVDRGLLTAWWPDGAGPQLVQVRMRQAGVRVERERWQAIGMAGSESLDVCFDAAEAELLGGVGDYLSRPGFWHGGAGVAACWWGGAVALAEALRSSLESRPAAQRSPFHLAALGRIDLALRSQAALFREGAAWIDAHPAADAAAVVLRLRLGAEAAAETAWREAGRALGATPFCRDAAFARMAADLPVFVRQSHAERDLAALGGRILDERPNRAESDRAEWTL